MTYKAKLAFIYSKDKLSGKLTKFFTGSYCYHVGWVVEETNTFYDMHLIRRKRNWPHYDSKNVILLNTLETVSDEYLEAKLKSDENTYGWIDYCFHVLKPLFHLFGKSTPNADGLTCSEMCYDDKVACGALNCFKESVSPADLEVLMTGRKNLIDLRG